MIRAPCAESGLVDLGRKHAHSHLFDDCHQGGAAVGIAEQGGCAAGSRAVELEGFGAASASSGREGIYFRSRDIRVQRFLLLTVCAVSPMSRIVASLRRGRAAL